MTQRKRLTHAQHLCRFVCGAHAVSEIATWVVLTASIERFPPPRWTGDLPTELSEKLIKAIRVFVKSRQPTEMELPAAKGR